MPRGTRSLELARKIGAVWSNTKRFDRILSEAKYISADNGKVLAEVKLGEQHVNHYGGIHGGYTSFLVDMVTSIAGRVLEKPKGGVSVELNVRFLKQAKIGDVITIEAETVKAGANLMFLKCVIRNKKDNSVVALGSHTKFCGGAFEIADVEEELRGIFERKS